MNIPSSLKPVGTPSGPRGRSLQAARPFNPGELIAHFTAPSIVLPDSPSLHSTCSHCLRTDLPVRACTGCRSTHYCSISCQKSDWSLVHKAECKVFKRVAAEGHDLLPTPVRALVQLLLRGDMKALLGDMAGHEAELRRNRAEWRDMELQAMAALHYLEPEATPRRMGEALTLLCKLAVNSFDRRDEDLGDSGLFFSPALAMLNHSCIPNAFVQFGGRNAILRATRAIKQDEEVEISYIEQTLHKSHRQAALQDRWKFSCSCPRCDANLDVYQVAREYPHITLNRLSVNPDLTVSPKPTRPLSDMETQIRIGEIYAACSDLDPSDAGKKWQLCQPLRKANLFAVEPLPQVLGQASIYFGERGNFPFSLVISCFLALNCDPIKSPWPFGPGRLKGLQMLANLLSNTAPLSGSKVVGSDCPLADKVVQALSKMDQATITQAVLAITVHWGPLAHSEEWQVYQEAGLQLNDIKALPGRGKERALIEAWIRDPSNIEAAMFSEYAVLKPLRELAGFALDVMDTEFGLKGSLAENK